MGIKQTQQNKKEKEKKKGRGHLYVLSNKEKNFQELCYWINSVWDLKSQ